jgi:murein DD-endopeptidase MepM/ murein hydrolase activator NlpD
MSRKLTIALLCWFVLIGQSYSQDVFVPRELKAVAVKKEAPEPVVKRAEPVNPPMVKERPAKEPSSTAVTAKTQTLRTESATAKTEKALVKEKPADVTKTVKAEPEKSVTAKEKAAVVKTEPVDVAKKSAVKPETVTEKTQKPAAPKNEAKVEAVTAKTEKVPPSKDQPASVAIAKKPTPKTESSTAKSEKAVVKDESVSVPTAKTANAKSEKPAKEELPTITVAKTQVKTEPPAPKVEKTSKPEVTAAKTKKEEPAPPAIAKTPLIKPEPVSAPVLKEPVVTVPVMSSSIQSAFTKIADGFDFPVGKPEAEGYYKARGFRSGGHVGEDWDGIRGGDTDLKDPIYSIGDGIVVFARDVHLGWGNVVIVRHAFRENGNVKYVDALYGHLNTMLVSRGQKVSRGQQIATMGTAHGQYDAHLHFEIRKNLEIGMSRSKFEKSFSNYYDPTQFIASHRHLSGGGANYKVAMNTFTHDWMYKFDKARDFSSRKRGTSESSAALKRALTSTNR